MPVRTSIVDDILRRAKARPATREEVRERQEQLRRVAQLLSEIAVSPDGPRRRMADSQHGGHASLG